MHPRIPLTLAFVLAAACTSHDGEETAKRPTRAPDDADRVIEKPQPEPDPKPEPEPEPEPQKIVAKASIGSVQMIEDCPDPPPPPPPTAPPAKEEAAMEPPPEDVPPIADIGAGATAKRAAPKPTVGGSASAAEVAPGASLAGDSAGFWQPCTQSTMQISFVGQGEDPGRVVIEQVRMLDPKQGTELATIKVRRPTSWVDGTYREWDEIVPARGSAKASYSVGMPNWSDVERKLGGTSSYGYMFLLEVEVTVDGERQTVRSPEFTREEVHAIAT